MKNLNKGLIIGGIIIIAVIVAVIIFLLFGSTAPVKLFSVEAKTGDITEKIKNYELKTKYELLSKSTSDIILFL